MQNPFALYYPVPPIRRVGARRRRGGAQEEWDAGDGGARGGKRAARLNRLASQSGCLPEPDGGAVAKRKRERLSTPLRSTARRP